MRRRPAILLVTFVAALLTVGCLGRYLRLGVDDPEGRSFLRRSRLVYAKNDGLYLARGDGSDARWVLDSSRLGDGGAVFQPSLSPDGTRLLFAGLTDLEVRDSTGRDLTINILTHSGPAVTGWRRVRLEKIAPTGASGRYEAFDVAGLSWSPDGHRIALGMSRAAGPDLVVLFDADGAPLRVYTLGDRKFSRIGGVSWFPGDHAVALGLEDPHDESGRGLTARMSLDGDVRPAGTIEPIGPGVFPAIAPDGRRIAVVDSRDGMWDIVLLSPEGKEMRRFARPAGRALNRLFWSADGRYLYYYSLASTGPLGLIEISMLRCLDTTDSRVFDLVRLS